MSDTTDDTITKEDLEELEAEAERITEELEEAKRKERLEGTREQLERIHDKEYWGIEEDDDGE